MSTSFQSDGRETMKQKIHEIRVDDSDIIISPGERSDNHLGHGGATEIGYLQEKHRTVDFSNGTWIKREQFKSSYCKTGDRRSEDNERSIVYTFFETLFTIVIYLRLYNKVIQFIDFNFLSITSRL